MSNHTVLGLDLREATMPEAIAAMVEAWLRAQEVEMSLLEWRKKNGLANQKFQKTLMILAEAGIPFKKDHMLTSEEVIILDSLLSKQKNR